MLRVGEQPFVVDGPSHVEVLPDLSTYAGYDFHPLCRTGEAFIVERRASSPDRVLQIGRTDVKAEGREAVAESAVDDAICVFIVHEIIVHADTEIGGGGFVGDVFVFVRHVAYAVTDFHDRHVAVEQVDFCGHFATHIGPSKQFVSDAAQVDSDSDALEERFFLRFGFRILLLLLCLHGSKEQQAN